MSTPALIIGGNVVDGLRHYGPFPSVEAAGNWADENPRTIEGPWWITDFTDGPAPEEDQSSNPHQLYIDAHGLHCPVCHLIGDIEGGAVDISKGGAFQSCSCGTCGATWTDVYALVDVSEVEQGP